MRPVGHPFVRRVASSLTLPQPWDMWLFVVVATIVVVVNRNAMLKRGRAVRAILIPRVNTVLPRLLT